jgi:hypothetical protein
MPLDPMLRETLEYLQLMLGGLRVTAHSQNFGRIVQLIDAALLEATANGHGHCPARGPRPMPTGGARGPLASMAEPDDAGGDRLAGKCMTGRPLANGRAQVRLH